MKYMTLLVGVAGLTVLVIDATIASQSSRAYRRDAKSTTRVVPPLLAQADEALKAGPEGRPLTWVEPTGSRPQTEAPEAERGEAAFALRLLDPNVQPEEFTSILNVSLSSPPCDFDKGAFVRTIDSWLSSPDVGMRLRGLSLLVAVEGAEGVGRWKEALCAEADPCVRISVIEHAPLRYQEVLDAPLVEALGEVALTDPDETVRAHALMRIPLEPKGAGVEVASQILRESPSEKLQDTAAQYLSMSGTPSAPARLSP